MSNFTKEKNTSSIVRNWKLKVFGPSNVTNSFGSSEEADCSIAYNQFALVFRLWNQLKLTGSVLNFQKFTNVVLKGDFFSSSNGFFFIEKKSLLSLPVNKLKNFDCNFDFVGSFFEPYYQAMRLIRF